MRVFTNREELAKFVKSQVEKGKSLANQVRLYREYNPKAIARGDEYYVPSLSRPGQGHRVGWYHKICTCELYRQMNRDNWGISWCHHLYAVQYYLEKECNDAKARMEAHPG